MTERFVTRQEVVTLAKEVESEAYDVINLYPHSKQEISFEALWSIAWNLVHDENNDYFANDLGEAWETLITGQKEIRDFLSNIDN